MNDGHMPPEAGYTAVQLNSNGDTRASRDLARTNGTQRNAVTPTGHISVQKRVVEHTRGFLRSKGIATQQREDPEDEMNFQEARAAALRAVGAARQSSGRDGAAPRQRASKSVVRVTTTQPAPSKTPAWVYVLIAVAALALLFTVVKAQRHVAPSSQEWAVTHTRST